MTGGFHTHDPSAVAYVIDPTLFETGSARVRVDVDGHAMGQTIAAFGSPPDFWTAWAGTPNTRVCTDVDSARLLKLFETTIAGR